MAETVSAVKGVPVVEPRRVKKNGRELGNAAAAAAICVDPRTGKKIKHTSYQWYVRVGKPAGNLAPAHVEVDNITGQRMYPLREVRAWHRKRRGRGNWDGAGAKARHLDEPETEPEHDDPAIAPEVDPVEPAEGTPERVQIPA